MFGFAWSELVLIGIVALIFIGPKDLPKAMKFGGSIVRKVRSMMSEAQASVEQLVREADLQDVRDEVANVVRVKNDIIGYVDPRRHVTTMMKEHLTSTPSAKPSKTTGASS